MESIADTDVTPGQILAGKFRIEQVLGRGGMGVVVAATHVHLDEKVALKFLLPAALQNPEAVRRFEREARAAVKIKSEHVARVTDVGKLESGAPYMVMEFLSGMDLGDYLEQRGPLPFAEAVDLLLQACEAIAEAHSLGIVHRDLKPANLFRIMRSDGTPSVKVLDFGISKVTSGSDASMTQTSSMMGSPYYMSPEQMTSAKNVDGRTDIWALGIMLHELLTGKVPYLGETIPEICAQVLQNPPPKLTLLRPDAPVELEQVIERALEKKREHRFDDVAAFAAAIAPFGGSDGERSVQRISKVLGVAPTARAGSSADLKPAARAIGPSDTQLASPEGRLEAGSTAASTLGGAAHTQLPYAPPTNKSKLPLMIGAAVVLLAVGGFALSRGSDESPDEASAAKEEAESSADVKVEEKVQPAEPKPAPKAEEPKPVPAPEVAPAPAPAPVPQVAPAPKPVVATRPVTAPRPTAKPAVAPAPAPAPKPRPASSLYLDRK